MACDVMYWGIFFPPPDIFSWLTPIFRKPGGTSWCMAVRAARLKTLPTARTHYRIMSAVMVVSRDATEIQKDGVSTVFPLTVDSRFLLSLGVT